MRKLGLFFLLIIATSLLSTIYAQESENGILLKIGDDVISKKEFLRTYQKNNDLSTSTEKELRDYLNLFIVYKMKVKEGKALLVDTAAAFQQELSGYRNQSAQQYLIDSEVTEHLVNEAIERSKSQIRAAHLLINCDYNASPKDTLAAYHKIMRIRNEIEAGKSFADAALEYSEDPSTRDRIDPQTKNRQAGNKGELGYFTVLSLIYPFESGAYNTPVGHVSQPIRSQFGYHLIYVKDKVPTINKIIVSQIFIADTNAARNMLTPEMKNRLETIQKALQTNSFESVVAQYSEDKATVERNGKVLPFRPEQHSGDFVTAAIHLPIGAVSQPVATTLGWHIIRLDTLEYAPTTLANEQKYAYRSRVARDSRSHKGKESLVARLKKEYKYEESGKNAAFKFFDKNLPTNYFQSTTTKIETLPNIEKLKSICSFADVKVPVTEFAKYISRYQGTNVADLNTFLNEKLESFVGEKMLTYENNHLEQKYPEFKALMTEFHDGVMLYEISSGKVWMKALQDSVGLENFYEKTKTNYPADKDSSTANALYKPLSEVKAIVVAEYQNYLEKEWVKELREKYPVIIDEKVFSTLLKK